MRKRHISLKGTWEYSAPRLVKEGGLAEGQELVLRREPDCKYDRNAVRAHAGRSKLGYLPKNLSAEIAAYLDSGGRYSATVAHLGTRTKNGKSYPSVAVDLCLHGMPEHPGVEELRQRLQPLIGRSGQEKGYSGYVCGTQTAGSIRPGVPTRPFHRYNTIVHPGRYPTQAATGIHPLTQGRQRLPHHDGFRHRGRGHDDVRCRSQATAQSGRTENHHDITCLLHHGFKCFIRTNDDKTSILCDPAST